ncbi:MAG: OmpA family protein [Proteobacteria bacterium]|nr:OmpA family protein [Pseudomonadota bacterium]
MLMLALSMLASAQDMSEVFPLPEMNAQLYRSPIDAQRTMWTDDASRAPHLWATGRLYASYTHGPVAALFFNDRKVQVVGDVLGFNLVGGVQLGPVRVGADLPVYAVATSGWEGQGGGGLGDAALDVKASILDPSTAPLGVALGARLGLPTATVKVPLGSPKVQSEISAIVDKSLGDVLLAMNLGARFGPKVEQDNLQLNDAFMLRLGAGYLITEDAGASLDVQMLRDFAQPGRTDDGISLTGMPIEAMLGGWGRVTDEIVLRGGLGRGLTRGIGAPAFRGVFSVGYEPSRDDDRDGDGLVDAIDDCPMRAEDFDQYEDTDGCPELDNDADGILDDADACPMEPEDFDGWEDEEGCPDPLTIVRVSLVDSGGEPVEGAKAVIAVGETDAKTGGASFEVELAGGDYELEATAPGYNTVSAWLSIPNGPPIDVKQVMEEAPNTGTVLALIVDTTGAPVEGRVAWSDSDSVIAAAGEAQFEIREGRYAMTASALGYFEDSRSVEVEIGEQSDVTFTLSKAQGTVSVTVVDSDGKAIEGASYTFGDDGVEQDLEGKSATSDMAPGQYTVIARAEGYAPARADVKVSAGAESAVSLTLTPTKVRVSVSKIEILEKVFFNTGKATIKSQSFGLLDEVAQTLKDREDIRVRVEGHTDSRGSESSNQLLSERRAASVRAYLIEHGVDGDRLTSVGLGESQPIDPAQNDAAWAKNRRVEFVIEN